jgi:hypothetical protein
MEKNMSPTSQIVINQLTDFHKTRYECPATRGYFVKIFEIVFGNRFLRKMNLKELEWDGMDWSDLAQDRDQWKALVNMLMNL